MVPKLRPLTVTLADPVPARFPGSTELNIGTSNVMACVIEPALIPVVTVMTLVPPTPGPEIQTIDVSASQTVFSAEVNPTRMKDVYEVSPNPWPWTETEYTPTAARFVGFVFVKEGISNDHASVTVPARSPVVKIIRRVPRTPCDVRHRTDVSDHHSVDSHAVSMTRAPSVYVVRPKFAPCTVTLADPVEARFVRVIVLSIGVSKENASVTVPT